MPEIRTIKLPDLPKHYVWSTEGETIFEVNMLKLTISRKWGWVHKRVATSGWIAIPMELDPDESVHKIMMECDILMLQLPGKIHVEIDEDA